MKVSTPREAKEVARHPAHADLCGKIDTGQVLANVGDGGDVGERRGLSTQRLEGGTGVARAGVTELRRGPPRIQEHEPMRLFEGERLEEHLMDYAVNGGAEADPEAQRHEDDG